MREILTLAWQGSASTWLSWLMSGCTITVQCKSVVIPTYSNSFFKCSRHKTSRLSKWVTYSNASNISFVVLYCNCNHFHRKVYLLMPSPIIAENVNNLIQISKHKCLRFVIILLGLHWNGCIQIGNHIQYELIFFDSHIYQCFCKFSQICNLWSPVPMWFQNSRN